MILADIEEPLCTTVPVLTEAFHLLTPGSIGSQRLMDFVTRHGLNIWFLDDGALVRAFELMIAYADHKARDGAAARSGSAGSRATR